MDKTIKCGHCQNPFVWSREEQAIYKVRGLPDPEYCPICRGIMEARNKDQARNQYERR